MKTLINIIKKELRRFFTDKRMLFSMFFPGILIYVIYSVMGSAMGDMMAPEVSQYIVYVENEPEELKAFLDIEGIDISRNPENISPDAILEGIQKDEIALYIIYEDDFINKMNNYAINSGKTAPKVEIYYNSTSTNSGTVYQLFLGQLDAFESSLVNKFDINPDYNIQYDQASNELMMQEIMGMVLPFILVVFLFTGSMSICSESIAGEKERGTIATLLVTPVKRSVLALGKIISLSITALASGMVSFAGLILSLPSLLSVEGAEFNLNMYSFEMIFSILLVIIVTVLLFTSLLTLISAYAKSVKEASSLCAPVMVLVMMLGMIGMFGGAEETNILMYFIPIFNSIQCFSDILSMNINLLAIGFTFIANSLVIALGIFLLTKMFNSEKIMFNK